MGQFTRDITAKPAAAGRPLRNLNVEVELPPFKTPDQLQGKPLIDAYAAWRTLKGARFAPRRDEIRPTQFKPVLASAFLIEVVEGGADFRVVLAGDRIARFLSGRLAKDVLLSTLPASLFQTRAFRALRHCTEAKAAVAVGPSRGMQTGGFLSLEVLLVPLSDDGAAVTGIFGAIHVSQLDPGNAPRFDHTIFPQ